MSTFYPVKRIEDEDEENGVKITLTKFETKDKKSQYATIEIERLKKDKWIDEGHAKLDINALRYLIK